MGEQVVGGDQDPALLVPEDRVRGAVAGPVQGPQGAVAEGDLLAVVERPGDLDVGAPAAEAARDALQGGRDLLGDAAAQHQLDREAVLGLGVLVEVGEALGGDADRGDLGAGVLDDDLDQPEVVDVLVGDDHQLQVVDRVAALAELALQLVERLARVGPGVDQGQRLVLEQVAVDPADRKGGGDREAVDSGQRRLLERRLGGQLGHARIIARTSSRFASMCSRETSDSRLRRSSGSVLEGRTLKCQSGWSIETPSRWATSAPSR